MTLQTIPLQNMANNRIRILNEPLKSRGIRPLLSAVRPSLILGIDAPLK